MAREKLYLIDGSNLIYRAYYAIRSPLTSRGGLPTNAAFGFTRMLRDLIRNEKPDHLGIAFDPPGPTFRHEMFPEYKAKREAPPEDLIPQFNMIREIVRAFDIPVLELQGFEADDVIGTLAVRFAEKDIETIIVSGDKDLAQLVNDSVTVLDTMKKVQYDSEKVREKFGVGPDQIVDLLGLAGDTSDNIPGIPGVGAKTAADLIAKFGDIETVLASVDQITGKKRKENLVEFADQARLSYRLATIKTDVPLELDFDDLAYKRPNESKLRPVLEELNFKSIVEEIFGTDTLPFAEKAPLAKTATEHEYIKVLTEDDLDLMIGELQQSDSFAFDTETTSTDAMQARLVGLSFCCAEGKAWYIPVGHRYLNAPKQLDASKVREKLTALLLDPQRRIIAQNAKYDMLVLLGNGYEVRNCDFDTMIASYLLDPEKRHGLDDLAAELFGHQMIKYSEVAGKGKNHIGFDMVPVDQATEYAAEDADFTWRVYKNLSKKLEAENMGSLFHDLEMPLVEVLTGMERAGVKIDLEKLREMSHRFGESMAEMTREIYEEVGEPFNLNSPQQLSRILFDQLGYDTKNTKKTKTGAYSTSQEVLEAMAVDYPIVTRILGYRSLMKLKSTYIDALPTLVNAKTGRIHTSYNQARTATGRLSSSKPNLQNIPIRGKEGRRIRSAFVPEPGKVLISADYSQVELRLLAHLSGDSTLVDAFRSGVDIHAETARILFGDLEGEVDAEMRAIAKTINFSVLYGTTPYGLSRQMKVSMGEAKKFIEDYFNHYSSVRDYFESCIEQTRQQGYVQTLFGRKRFLPEINSKNKNIREQAERMAINTPIQGTAADLIKQAMINLYSKLRQEIKSADMIMQVHDELVIEAAEEDCQNCMKLIKIEMESALELSVDLTVDVNYGQNWSEAH
jgi:DNA polymerase I